MEATDATLHLTVVSPQGGTSLRREVRRHLDAAGVSPATIDDALLVLSELVTNALDAALGGDPVQVAVSVGASTVRLVVENSARSTVVDPRRVSLAGAPVAMPPPSSERGRGLPLVAALANRVAVDVGGPVTAVQAELWTGPRQPC